MNCDIIIRNGRVIDPARNIDAIRTVAISKGKITVPEKCTGKCIEINAAGKIVIPGIIDHHSHFHYRATDIGVPVDIAMLPHGVTTAVDAGSSGVATVRSFIDNCRKAIVKTRIYLHVSPLGMATKHYQEIIKPEKWDPDEFADVIAYSKGMILGLKMKIGKITLGSTGGEPFYDAVRLADKLEQKIVIHPTDPVIPMDEVLDTLRSGDTLAHVYNSRGDTIMKNGLVSDAAWRARERGVIFDVAHGCSNFSFDIAEQAIKEGFLPDIISSDYTTMAWNKPPVYNILNVMSKFLLLGLSLNKIVECVTAAPAAYIGEKGIVGTLAEGASGDVAIIEAENRNCIFTDADGKQRRGEVLLVPKMTIADGCIVSRAADFN